MVLKISVYVQLLFVNQDPSLLCFFKVSDALQIPSTDSAKNHDVSPGSLRRSNSSPSVMSGSSDTLSPRDSISDVVQFGPLPKTDKQNLTAKSSDSDKSDITGIGKMPSQPVASAKRENERTESGTNYECENKSMDVKFGISDDDITNDLTASKATEVRNCAQQVSQSGKLNPDKDVSLSAPKEYTSMLTKQLSPSPASSDTSSTQDEVGELPSGIRRVRGHTIAVVQPSGSPSEHGASKVFSSKSSISNDSSKVGVSPSFVFLQFYHSGQLQTNEMPFLLPNNEVGKIFKFSKKLFLLNCLYIEYDMQISLTAPGSWRRGAGRG